MKVTRRVCGRWWTVLAAGLLLSAAALDAQERRPGGDSPYSIHLKSGTFTPAPGIEAELRLALPGAQRRVGLIQLDEVPDESVRAQLEAAGVELLEYVPHNTWMARLPAGLEKVAAVPGVRWIGRLLPEDKLAPELIGRIKGPVFPAELSLDVAAFEGSLDEAAARVEALGGRVLGRDEVASTLQAALPGRSLRTLAASDAVQWISADPPKALFNDRSRANARADQVQAAPYGLSGTGVDLGIWDGGQIYAHTDFTGRLTVVQTGTISAHSTHVAGTMAGDGTRSVVYGYAPLQFRGYSTAADIIGYDFNGTPPSEHNGAINTYGIDNSQNSWGLAIDQAQYNNCALYGNYHSYSREYDRIITGLYSRRIPVVFAAGNERNDGDCGMSAVPPYVNYANVAPPATAKNVIAVGAINGDDDTITTFSSWGPLDDGRLKPDVMAAGDHTAANPVSQIFSTATNNGYVGNIGTSMAAPAVSGAIGLLLERYRAVCPSSPADPLPSTIKGLLIHTARDLDSATTWFNPGPDYASGYGAMDVQAAVDMLPFYREDQVSHGQTDTFQITVTQMSDLKVTLAWDDPAAAANATIALINNLDLELVDPLGGIHRPWILDPLNPANAATQGVDNRNVVEQVEVDTVTLAIAGVWTIRVIGTNVPNGPQSYSLVTQHLQVADLSCQGAPAGDAWIMDKDLPLTPVDTGAEPNPDTGPMWISNQIWVRHAPDGIMQHQNPEFGQTNYVYARVRNFGATTLNTVRAFVYYADANSGLGWPQSWHLLGERTIVNLAAGASVFIEPLPWNPPGTGHYCLYVRLITDQDPMTFAEGPGVYANTRNNNNIAWKNVNIVDLVPFVEEEVEVRFGNALDREDWLELNFDARPDKDGFTLLDFVTVDVQIGEDLQAHLEEQGLELEGEGFERIDDRTFRMVSRTAFFSPIVVQDRRDFTLRISFRRFARRGASPVYSLDFNQNFPPLSGAKPNQIPTEGYDPQGPNTGGVRYEVLVPNP